MATVKCNRARWQKLLFCTKSNYSVLCSVCCLPTLRVQHCLTVFLKCLASGQKYGQKHHMQTDWFIYSLQWNESQMLRLLIVKKNKNKLTPRMHGDITSTCENWQRSHYSQTSSPRKAAEKKRHPVIWCPVYHVWCAGWLCLFTIKCSQQALVGENSLDFRFQSSGPTRIWIVPVKGNPMSFCLIKRPEQNVIKSRKMGLHLPLSLWFSGVVCLSQMMYC